MTTHKYRDDDWTLKYFTDCNRPSAMFKSIHPLILKHLMKLDGCG